MPSDFPDWGGQYNDRQFFPLFDQAELAARLGSLMTYDRRGSVIWQYGFQYGVGDVGPAAVGAGSYVVLYEGLWEFPPFSCRMAAAGVAGSYASIERRVAVPQPALVGFQAAIRFSPGAEHVSANVYHYDGAGRWYSEVRVDQLENKFQAWVSPGVYVDLIDPLTDLNTSNAFAHHKLVVDLSTHALVRGILDQHEFDLSPYTMVRSADAQAENLRCRVVNLSVSGAAGSVYVGSLIITASEPPNS